MVAIAAEAGSFDTTSSAAPVSQTISTGQGADVIFLLPSRHIISQPSSPGWGMFNEHVYAGIHGLGWSDATNDYSASIASRAALATSDTNGAKASNQCLRIIHTSGGDAYQGTISSITASSFVCSWDETMTTEQQKMGYFLLNNIPNVAMGAYDVLTAAGTGSRTVTSGLSFQPSVIFFMLSGLDATETVSNYETYSFGFTVGTGAGNSACVAVYFEDGVATASANAYRAHSDDHIAMGYAAPSAATDVTFEVKISAFNSNGFDINVTNAYTSDVRIFWLALGGIDAQIQHHQLTDAATNTVTFSGMTPEAVFSLGISNTSAPSLAPNVATNGTISTGWSDGTNDICFGVSMQDTTPTTTDVGVVRSNTNFITTQSDANILDEYTVNSFNSGSITIGRTNFNNTRYVSILALAETTAAAANYLTSKLSLLGVGI